jgi:hypothetical protein
MLLSSSPGSAVAPAVVGVEVVPAAGEVVRREATEEVAAEVPRGVKEDLHGLEAVSLSNPSSRLNPLRRPGSLNHRSSRSSRRLRFVSGRDIVLAIAAITRTTAITTGCAATVCAQGPRRPAPSG